LPARLTAEPHAANWNSLSAGLRFSAFHSIEGVASGLFKHELVEAYTILSVRMTPDHLAGHHNISTWFACCLRLGLPANSLSFFPVGELRAAQSKSFVLSKSAGMAGDDAAILHLMYPITRLSDRRIVRDEEERHLFFLYDSL